MKIMLINGSPRKQKSATFHILENLETGMRAAGAETHLVNLAEHKIKPCTGCYSCWTKTPGECIIRDDMPALVHELDYADLIVYGTPLYHFNMTGIMKNFIDRTLPRIEPWLIPHSKLEGVTIHPARVVKKQAMFLVSVAGFPELSHFDALVYYFKKYAEIANVPYVGQLLRTYSETMAHDQFQSMFTDYYPLVQQAGHQLVENGAIDAGLNEKLHAKLFQMDQETTHQLANSYWNGLMDDNNVPMEQRHVKPIIVD